MIRLLAFILFLSYGVLGCERHLSEDDIIGDWKIISRYSTRGDSFVKWDRLTPDPLLIFCANGELKTSESLDQKYSSSTWSLDEQHEQIHFQSILKNGDSAFSIYQVSNWQNKTMEIRNLRYGMGDLEVLLYKVR